MHVGVDIFLTDYSISPFDLGPALEERGFESIWLPEHSHIPLSRKSPWPGGADLPKRYYDVVDPMVTLGALAGCTRKLKLATGICLIIQRDVLQLAKETATIDLLSNGRLILGIGGGWNEEEMRDHGTVFKTRFKLMKEKVEVLKAVWTQTKPEYQGEMLNFEPMMTWPKPVQEPHPPILVGGGFPHAARRAAAFGDGWLPLGGRGWDVAETLPRFRQMVAEADRDPESMDLTVFGVKPGADEIAKFKDAGVNRVTLSLSSEAAKDEVLKTLDDYAAMAGL